LVAKKRNLKDTRKNEASNLWPKTYVDQIFDFIRVYDPQFMVVRSENDEPSVNEDEIIPPNTLKIYQDRKASYKPEFAH